MPIAYLAGPIDDVDKDSASWWVGSLRVTLATCGVNSYSPLTAITQTNMMRADAAKICAINRDAIRHCDFMIAYLAGKGRGFGTIREIEFARACGLPVYVIGSIVSLEAHDVVLVDPELFNRVETWRGLLLGR